MRAKHVDEVSSALYQEYKTANGIYQIEVEANLDAITDVLFAQGGFFANVINLFHAGEELRGQNPIQNNPVVNLFLSEDSAPDITASSSLFGFMINNLVKVCLRHDARVIPDLRTDEMTTAKKRGSRKSALNGVDSGGQLFDGKTDQGSPWQVERKLCPVGLPRFDCNNYLQLFFMRRFRSAEVGHRLVARILEFMDYEKMEVSSVNHACQHTGGLESEKGILP